MSSVGATRSPQVLRLRLGVFSASVKLPTRINVRVVFRPSQSPAGAIACITHTGHLAGALTNSNGFSADALRRSWSRTRERGLDITRLHPGGRFGERPASKTNARGVVRQCGKFPNEPVAPLRAGRQ